MPVKRNIPNAITCGNLLCGCLALIKVFENDLLWAAYLVGIAAILDFFDGFAARLLKVASAIGKDLDSLADMVTFGVVPGMIMFKLIAFSFPGGTSSCLPYMALIIPVFSCIRLAIFNNDTRQSDTFIGLPTPANGILIASLPVVANYFSLEASALPASLPWLLSAFSIIMAFMLVAPVKMIALKFKTFKWRGNEIRYIFLLFAVGLFALFQVAGIPLVIVAYILFSLINNIFKKQNA